MFMKTLYTPGVAHLSYIFGDGGQASVIDPRRDVNEYLEIAHRRGAKIAHLRTAVHVTMGDLPSKLKQIPRRRPITTFCESGERATIAAAFLRRQGMEPVEVCLGSMSACSHVECQVIIGD